MTDANRKEPIMFRIVKQAFAVAAMVGVLAAVDMTVAAANSGTVKLTQSCAGGGGTVSLHNDVAPNHRVDVISTIPGRPGFTNGHYDTTGNPGDQVIWAKSWTQPKAGTVTLKIFRPDGTLEQQTSASISAPNCTTTTIPAPTTTVPATVTTTVPETTTVPATVTTAEKPTPTSQLSATSTVAPPTDNLPETGSSTFPLAIVGGALVAAGAALATKKRAR